MSLPISDPSASITITWLGVAGISIQVNGQILAFDPFFTRPELPYLFFGRVASNEKLAVEKLPDVRHIFLTHAHFDHLMDVPAIAMNSHAHVYTSPNGCRLLQKSGVPAEQIHQVEPGDRLALEPFRVQVMSAKHPWLPGYNPGRLPEHLNPPLRLREYVMDNCLSFLVEINGTRLLNWHSIDPSGAPPADVLFCSAFKNASYYRQLLGTVHPSWVIPTHWDNLFLPLSKPIRPGPRAPTWSWPPLGLLDLGKFSSIINGVSSQATVVIPEIFKPYTFPAHAKINPSRKDR